MTQYHVTLDGQGYLVELTSYRKRLEVGPVPEGPAELSAWEQTDWRRGVGYGRWEPGVYQAGPRIDPSQGGLRIGRGRSTVFTPGASVTDLWAMAVYGGKLYVARGDGPEIYESADGTSWATAHSTGYAGHRAMALWNGWLMVGASDSGKLTRYDGTTWASPWVTLTGTQVGAAAGWYGAGGSAALYAGVKQGSGGAVVYRVDSAGGVASVGTLGEAEVTAMVGHGGALWVAGVTASGGEVRGGLYRYDGVGLVRVLSLAENGVASFVEWRGRLWAGSWRRGKVWVVEAGGLREVWTLPQVVGIGGTWDYAQPLRGLAVMNDALHVAVVTGEGLGVYVGTPLGPAAGVPGPGVEGELRRGLPGEVPALGWASPSIGSAGQEARGIAVFGGEVYLTNKRAAGANVVRLTASAVDSAGAVWVSGRFDGGLPGTEKLAVRIRVRHSALRAGDSVGMDYEVDGSGTWVNAGTSDVDGTTEKVFELGSGVIFRELAVRLTLAVTDTSGSVEVTGVVVEWRPKPVAKASWEWEARLEGTAALPLVRLDGTAEPKTGAQLADTLWTTAGKRTGLSYVDLDGETKTVEVVGVEERVAEMAQPGQPTGWQTRARVRLREL